MNVEQPAGIRGADEQQSGPPHPPDVDQEGLKEGRVAITPMTRSNQQEVWPSQLGRRPPAGY